MSTTTSNDAAPTGAAIARLNDDLRKGYTSLGRIFITEGIHALPLSDQIAIAGKVKRYDHFPEGDDPYGEHDFGAFDHNGQRIFWKIDYYDRATFGTGAEAGSESPADPVKTLRVLTVMLADEY